MNSSINYLKVIAEESEHKHTILTDGGCANEREYIDGSLNYERIPIDGCSQLYVGDINIILENFSAIPISHKHEDEYLVTNNEEPRSTSPSPLELQEVDQIKKKEEEEVHSHEPSFINSSLNMSEMDIHEALIILHDTQELVSNSCWKFSSFEDASFLEDMYNIQRAMCTIEGNFMSLVFDINNLVEIN